MQLVYIAVRSNEELWGLDNEHRIYHYHNNQWEQISGELKQIAVNEAGDVWGAHPRKFGNVMRYNPITKTWEQHGSGVLEQLTLGAHDKIWAINWRTQVYSSYLTNNINWQHIFTNLRQIVASSRGTWGVDYLGNFFQYDTPTNTFKPFVTCSGCAYLAAGKDELWSLHFDKSAYRYNSNNQWEKMAGPEADLQQIAISPSGDVWGLSHENLLYRYINNTWEYQDITGVSDNKYFKAQAKAIKTSKKQIQTKQVTLAIPAPLSSNAALHMTKAWQEALPKFSSALQRSVKDAMARSLQVSTSSSLTLDLKVIAEVLPTAQAADLAGFVGHAKAVLDQHIDKANLVNTQLKMPSLEQFTSALQQTVNSLHLPANFQQQADNVLAAAQQISLKTVTDITTGFLGKLNDVTQEVNSKFDKVADLTQGITSLLNQGSVKFDDLFTEKAQLKTAQAEYEDFTTKASQAFDSVNQGLEVAGTLAGLLGHAELGQKIVAVGQAAVSIGSNVATLMAGGAILGSVGAIAGATAALFSALGLFGSRPSEEQKMLQDISKQISQLAEHVDKRFDRVESMLVTINEQMHGRFDQLEDMLVANNQQMHLRFDRIETTLIEQFRETKAGMNVLRAKIDSIQAQLNGMRQLLDQGLVNLGQQSFLTLKVKIEDIKNYPNPDDRQTYAIDYNTGLKDILRHHINSGVLAGAAQVLPAQVLVDEVNSRGLIRSINYLAAYAAQYDRAIPTITVVNPALWREVTSTYLQLIKQAPCLFTITWDNVASLQEFKAEGERLQQLFQAIQLSEGLFRQLIQHYRYGLTTSLAKLMKLDNVDGDSLALVVQEVDTARRLLMIYSSMAFPADEAKHQALHRYLEAELWDGAAIVHLIQTATTSKALALTGMKYDAFKAIDEFENRVLAKVESAKITPLVVPHIVSAIAELELMRDLNVGKVLPLPAANLDNGNQQVVIGVQGDAQGFIPGVHCGELSSLEALLALDSPEMPQSAGEETAQAAGNWSVDFSKHELNGQLALAAVTYDSIRHAFSWIASKFSQSEVPSAKPAYLSQEMAQPLLKELTLALKQVEQYVRKLSVYKDADAQVWDKQVLEDYQAKLKLLKSDCLKGRLTQLAVRELGLDIREFGRQLAEDTQQNQNQCLIKPTAYSLTTWGMFAPKVSLCPVLPTVQAKVQLEAAPSLQLTQS